MLHLIDSLAVLVIAEFDEPPVLEHPRVQEILVDRGQLVLEDLVQVFDDGGIAFHSGLRRQRLVDETVIIAALQRDTSSKVETRIIRVGGELE